MLVSRTMRGSDARWPLLAGALAGLSLLASGCGGSKPLPAANGATTTTTSHATTTTSTVATPRSGATKLVDEWAACERSHGRAQTDPTIDAHGVINIAVPRVLPGRVASAPRITGGPETPTGTCSTYLAAAQRELRATHRVAPAPSAAMYLKYVSCMRANGVPKYPYPEANDPSKTDFIGSGVDPTSPAVLKVNDLCGAKLGLPAWWVKGYGSPGDISVRSSGLNGVPPRCAFAKNGCGAVGARLPGL